MTLPIYPDASVLPGLGWSQKWSPEFFNMKTETTPTGADIDLAFAQYPLHNFELTYDFLRDRWFWVSASLEFKTMMGFFLQTGGSIGRFLFRNSDDHFIAAQQIGTGDGTTTTFGPIQRSFGANGYIASEPVGQIDTTKPILVRLGNIAQPSSIWTLDTATPLNQTITFATAPGLGVPITMDFSYFYYCKFPDNTNTFEKFMDRLWLLQKVSIKSCRPGA
ncbi:MAG: DUF2460 domain-containing protein [Rhizomicrobium sp.]